MDMEKVIKDLEECMTASCRGYRPRLSCPYNDEEWDIMRDALALLKEQEELGKELTNAMELIHKKNERIKKLEEQVETLTRWRANAGAFD